MEDLSKLIDARQNSITARDLQDQTEFTYDSRFKNIDNKYQQLFSRSKSKQYTAQILLNKFINEKLTARIKKEPKVPIFLKNQAQQNITNRGNHFSIQSQYQNKPNTISSQYNSTEQKTLPINYIKTVRNSSRIQKELNMATTRLTPISVESFFHKVIEYQTIDQSILLQDQKKMIQNHNDTRIRNSQTVVDSSTNRMGKTDIGQIPTFDHSFFNKSVYSSQATRDVFIHSGKAKEIKLGYESLIQTDTPLHFRQNTLKQSSNNHYQQLVKKSNDLEKSLKSGSAISEMSKSPNNQEYEVKSNIVRYGKQDIAEKTQNSLQDFDETFSKLAKKLQLSNQKKIEQPFLTGENKVTNDEKLKLIYSSMKFKDDDIIGTGKSVNESLTSDKNRQSLWKQAIINEEERAEQEKDIVPMRFQKFETFNKPQIKANQQNELNSPQSRQSKNTTLSVPNKAFIPSIKSGHGQSEQSKMRNMTQQIKQRRNIIFFQNIKNQQFGQNLLPNVQKHSEKVHQSKTQKVNQRNVNMSIVSPKSTTSAMSEQSKKIVHIQSNQMDLKNRIRDSHIINSIIEQKDRPLGLYAEQQIDFVPQTFNQLKFKSKILHGDLREQQQNQRILDLIENLQTIKQDTLSKLVLKNKYKIVEKENTDNQMEQIIYKGVQEEQKNDTIQYETNIRKIFEIILKESEMSNEIFYNQTESEFFEQDKFIKELQVTKNDQIQKLRIISNNSESELIFERLFDYLFQQTIRDKILGHYKEFKLSQAIKNTQEQERLLKIEERRIKLNNPETKRNIQSTIQNIDYRIQIELKRLADQRNRQELGIKNFINYLKHRDISKDISESIKSKKQRMCQIYQKIHNVNIDDEDEKRKLDLFLFNKSQEFKNQTEAIGYAKSDQLISIIQKTKLNQQRDNLKNTNALQVVAINSDENSEALKHFVDEICNDQSMIYERNLLNQLFKDLIDQNRNNLIKSEGTCQIIQTQKYQKIYTKTQSDSVTPNTSQRQSNLSFRKPKQISNEASTIKQTLLDFKRLLYPKKVQLKEQLNNYNNYDLLYITNILKFKKSIQIIFKQKNIGELYTGLPDDLNSKSNFESAFELPEFVFSGKIIMNSMNQQVCPRADMSRHTARKGSVVASPNKIESLQNVNFALDKSNVNMEDLKQRDMLAEKIRNIFFDKSKKIKKLFGEQMTSKQFYDLSKRGHSYFGDQNKRFEGNFKTPNLYKECLLTDPQENEQEDIQSLVQSPMDQIYAYLCSCNKNFVVPSPIYSKIKVIDRPNQNSNSNLCSLFLYQYPISKDQAVALRDFLISQVQLNMPNLPFDRQNLVNQPHMIHSIILDNCGIGDFELSNILVGLLIQSTIKHFSYFNNSIGPLSIRIFNDFFRSPTQLIEFNLHNIQNSNIKFLQQLTLSLTQQKQLVHLRISQVNLKDDMIMQNICLIIENQNKTLYTLDLSGTSLSSKHLNKLAETLLDFRNVLRSLNISYNLIKNGIDAQKYSAEFLNNFNSYLNNTEVLNHLDISGMFLFYDHNYNQQLLQDSLNEKEEFINLFENMANCKNLQGIHISDNNIEKNQELYDQLCEIFAFKNLEIKKSNLPNDRKLRDIQKILIKLDPSLDPKLFQSQISTQNYVDVSLYSDHLLKGMSLKQIQEDKKANLAQTGRGIVRDGHNLENIFVLNRILNQSELIFNTRNSSSDSNFDFNSSSQWVLDRDQKFDCNACQKHKYTIIFFDQSSWQNNINGGLKPIQDPEDIEFIKSNYFKEHLVKKNVKQAPLILSSFKNKMNFTNQMISVQLYTLLTIIDLKIITKSDFENVKEIKKGIFNLINDMNGIQQQLFQESLNNFQFILHDKIHRNDLIDIQTINEPQNLRLSQFQQEVYVFADYLPAGHHQILIYCPVTDRIWYKDFLSEQSFKLNFNNEFPMRTIENKVPVIQKIWKQQVGDLKKSPFNMDMQSIILQNFLNNNLKLFIFQSSQRVLNIIENFHVLIIRLFKFLHIDVLLQEENGEKAASNPNKTFPKIQFKVFLNFFYQNMTMLMPNATLYFDIEQKVQQTLGNEVIALKDEDLIRQMIFLHAFYASRNKGKMPNVLEVKPAEKEKKQKKGQEPKQFNQIENMNTLKDTLMKEGLDRCELILFILYLVKLIYNVNLSIKISDNTQKTIKPVSFEEILYQFFTQLESSLSF